MPTCPDITILNVSFFKNPIHKMEIPIFFVNTMQIVS